MVVVDGMPNTTKSVIFEMDRGETDFQGLGTSTSADAKKYFNDLDKHRLAFETIKPDDRALIDMAFSKKKADERKEWLRQFRVSRLSRDDKLTRSLEHTSTITSLPSPLPTLSTKSSSSSLWRTISDPSPLAQTVSSQVSERSSLVVSRKVSSRRSRLLSWLGTSRKRLPTTTVNRV